MLLARLVFFISGFSYFALAYRPALFEPYAPERLHHEIVHGLARQNIAAFPFEGRWNVVRGGFEIGRIVLRKHARAHVSELAFLDPRGRAFAWIIERPKELHYFTEENPEEPLLSFIYSHEYGYEYLFQGRPLNVALWNAELDQLIHWIYEVFAQIPGQPLLARTPSEIAWRALVSEPTLIAYLYRLEILERDGIVVLYGRLPYTAYNLVIQVLIREIGSRIRSKITIEDVTEYRP